MLDESCVRHCWHCLHCSHLSLSLLFRTHKQKSKSIDMKTQDSRLEVQTDAKNQMTIVCCRVFHNKQCFVSTAATYKSDEKRCCAKVWSDLLSINIIPILMSNIKQSSPKPTSPSSSSHCSIQLGQQHSLRWAPRPWQTN